MQSRLPGRTGKFPRKCATACLTNEPPNRGKNDKFAVATTTAAAEAAAEVAAAESRAAVAAGNDL